MKIFLVDDDEEDRDVFFEAIRESYPDAEFMMASDGEQVLPLLEKTTIPPDYIFLDINMPRMNGIQCLTMIKSHREFKGLDVIVYSTTTSQQEIGTATRLGARFMVKEPDYRKLVRDLQVLVSEKARPANARHK